MSDLLWRIPEHEILFIEEWEENGVVFQSLSGQTHYLNGLALEVLKVIQIEPIGLQSLVEEITTVFEVEDKNELIQQVKQLLSVFENLGIIEPLKRENLRNCA